jgi:Apea-like HEPN
VAGTLRSSIRKIDSHFHKGLALAVRRTLGSIAMRRDPADGLVDAVIALENMFGTGQSEVGFRLSAALAWLLASDAESRIAHQRSVGKLYTLRSKIVHGSDVDPTTLYSERDAASQLAVDALRKLFTDWPTLIAAGDQRGKLLIL